MWQQCNEITLITHWLFFSCSYYKLHALHALMAAPLIHLHHVFSSPVNFVIIGIMRCLHWQREQQLRCYHFIVLICRNKISDAHLCTQCGRRGPVFPVVNYYSCKYIFSTFNICCNTLTTSPSLGSISTSFFSKWNLTQNNINWHNAQYVWCHSVYSVQSVHPYHIHHGELLWLIALSLSWRSCCVFVPLQQGRYFSAIKLTDLGYASQRWVTHHWLGMCFHL